MLLSFFLSCGAVIVRFELHHEEVSKLKTPSPDMLRPIVDPETSI